ncbi:Uncharacterised protein [Bordetella pertussis]|nr:Uncharacterised protein [Bordetella pertussis]
MPPGVLDDIGEHPAVLACELGRIGAYAIDEIAVFVQCRIARMQAVQPQDDAGLVVQHGVAQTVVQGVEIAAEILGKIHRLGDRAQYRRTAARAVAIGNQQRHAQFARGVDHGLLVQPVVIQSAAAAQLALQSRLTVTRHAPASPKNFTTSSIRRIVSA